jgi:hypothetical protein
LKRWDSPNRSSHLIPWFDKLWLLPIRPLEEKTPWKELQVPKRGDLYGDSDFDPNVHSNTLTTVRQMDRKITRVYCEWGGIHPSKYPWFDMLSLLVREIGLITTTFGSPHKILWFILKPPHKIIVKGIIHFAIFNSATCECERNCGVPWHSNDERSDYIDQKAINFIGVLVPKDRRRLWVHPTVIHDWLIKPHIAQKVHSLTFLECRVIEIFRLLSCIRAHHTLKESHRSFLWEQHSWLCSFRVRARKPII